MDLPDPTPEPSTGASPSSSAAMCSPQSKTKTPLAASAPTGLTENSPNSNAEFFCRGATRIASPCPGLQFSGQRSVRDQRVDGDVDQMPDQSTPLIGNYFMTNS